MRRSLSPFYREGTGLELLGRLPEGLHRALRGLNNQRTEVKARVTVASQLFRSACTRATLHLVSLDDKHTE